MRIWCSEIRILATEWIDESAVAFHRFDDDRGSEWKLPGDVDGRHLEEIVARDWWVEIGGCLGSGIGINHVNGVRLVLSDATDINDRPPGPHHE